ncbi:MAG: hypothetical protein LAP13_07895 [Acidobacteriia bacterium]|nr:hypothetical protein [Terriglobia bacterium]
MENHPIRHPRLLQVSRPHDEGVTALETERLLLGAAIAFGTPEALGDLKPEDFCDEWHRMIALAILEFRGRRFTVARLADVVPSFLAYYVRALQHHYIFAMLYLRRRN